VGGHAWQTLSDALAAFVNPAADQPSASHPRVPRTPPLYLVILCHALRSPGKSCGALGELTLLNHFTHRVEKPVKSHSVRLGIA
jgi:hypothetical protein